MPTVSRHLATADWHEREVYDLSGVRFTAIPTCGGSSARRIGIGHPLRKDYEMPLEYHGIRGR